MIERDNADVMTCRYDTIVECERRLGGFMIRDL
jgi:hypothetical protein